MLPIKPHSHASRSVSEASLSVSRLLTKRASCKADKETYYHSKKTYYHSKENYDDWWNANKECLVSPHLDHSFLLSFVGVRVRQTKRATWVTSSSSSPLKSVQVLSRVCAAVLCAPNALPPTPSFSLSFPYQCLRSRVCARAGQVKTHVCVCRSCAGQDKLVCVKRWQRCVSCV